MRTPIAVVVLAISRLAVGSAFAQDHGHDQHPHPVPADTASTRYPVDASLQQGMRNIRTAVDGLGHYEAGHAAPADAVRLAGEVEDNVRFVIANCKLPPEADAALHGIILPLMQNAGTLKSDPEKRETIAAMRKSLADYARQFDDPEAMPR